MQAKNMVEFYRNKIGLGFKDVYKRILHRAQSHRDGCQYIRLDQYATFLVGVPRPIACASPEIKRLRDDVKVDVPVWFGNPKATCRILAVGIEPHGKYPELDVEKVNHTVFGIIFGAERWNRNYKGKHNEPKIYFDAFQSLLNRAGNGELFLVFTDLVKEVPAQKHPERKTYADRAEKWKSKFLEEYKLIRPTHVFALGKDVCCKLNEWHIQNVMYIRHPANGGKNIAKDQINELLKSIFPRKKSKRSK